MPVFRLAALLSALVLAACAQPKPFVKPVAAAVNAEDAAGAGKQSEDGYLRIFVSSNLDATGKAMDFGDKDERPALLLISARFGRGTVASFSADTNAEIPVLLYDIQGGQTLSSVVDNALLTEGMLIDPESLSKSPHLQIFVRGVPADKAKWVTNLLEVATAEPVLKIGLSFVPGASAVTNLSTRLGDLLSEEIKSTNQPWEERTLLGLRPDQGLYSLDGRQFIVLLNSTTMELQPPPRLARCDTARSPTGLCLPDGAAWNPQQAYVRFELDVSDYRSIKDFIGTGVGCESDERTWSEYRALLASGQLARKQTQYERDLLARGDLLLAARRAQSEFIGARYAGRMLQLAQHLALLATPDDAYWREHYQTRAQALESCVRTEAVRGQTQYATVWDASLRVFAQSRSYPAWSATLQANTDAQSEQLRMTEQELGRVQRLLRNAEIRKLDAQSQESILTLEQQLQQMLLPSYRNIVEQIIKTADTTTLEGSRVAIAQLTELAPRTLCAPCRTLIEARAQAVREAQPVPAPVPTPEPLPAPDGSLTPASPAPTTAPTPVEPSVPAEPVPGPAAQPSSAAPVPETGAAAVSSVTPAADASAVSSGAPEN